VFRKDLTQLGSAAKRNLTAQVVKGQQLAGHFPDSEDIDRIQRILSGEISIEDAFVEIDAEYRRAA
jgi:hypothetical protein